MVSDQVAGLFKDFTGSSPYEMVELSPAGSNRRYFRLSGPQSLIGVYGPSREENEAFIYLSRFFRSKNQPVPEVYAVSPDRQIYLQQDLGDIQLFDAVRQGRVSGCFPEEEKTLLFRTIEALPAIQLAGKEGLDYSHCYPQPEFSRRTIFWDLNYFKYCFLKATGVDFQEDRLEDVFERLADRLLQVESETFLYRDFQSRNVMLVDGNPFFIDFQGGRKGPLHYDIVSFLWQAKANYPGNLKEELLEAYLDKLESFIFVNKSMFRLQLVHFVLFRTLQVLGAYGFRGFFERKNHFIESIPYALRNLEQILNTGCDEYAYLSDVLRKLTDKLNDDNKLCLK